MQGIRHPIGEQNIVSSTSISRLRCIEGGVLEYIIQSSKYLSVEYCFCFSILFLFLFFLPKGQVNKTTVKVWDLLGVALDTGCIGRARR